MKVKLICEIEAEIIDKEELESIQVNLNSRSAMTSVENLWERIIKKTLKGICPYPVYCNKRVKVRTKYLKEDDETQEFQLGDTAYMIDEDYRFFESEVYKIELDNGRYYYDTDDGDFESSEIGKWVFKSYLDRQLYLESKMG